MGSKEQRLRDKLHREAWWKWYKALKPNEVVDHYQIGHRIVKGFPERKYSEELEEFMREDKDE
jgi:hypothetical protein